MPTVTVSLPSESADNGKPAALRHEVHIGIEQVRSGCFSDRSIADAVAAVCGSSGTGSVASIRPARGDDVDVANPTTES